MVIRDGRLSLVDEPALLIRDLWARRHASPEVRPLLRLLVADQRRRRQRPLRIWYRVEVPPKRIHGRGKLRPGFVCGIETDEAGTIVTAAPIMGWAIGKDLDHVANWVLFSGGTIEHLDVVALDREEP